MGFPTPRRFIPKHPEKYNGDASNIVARSSWELRVMKYLDATDNIIYWASEELAIPYISPVDGRQHRYFVDFILKVKNKHGEITVHLWEVKPHIQTLIPVQGKRRTKKFLTECSTYVVNQAKWKAAEEFCRNQGWKFSVLTEYELGIKKRR